MIGLPKKTTFYLRICFVLRSPFFMQETKENSNIFQKALEELLLVNQFFVVFFFGFSPGE